MTTLDELLRLAPAPAVPVDAEEDWAAVEAEVGVGLPADFKAMAARYGRGEFCDLLFTSPIEDGVAMLDDERELRDEFSEDYPYPLYPEPGGLLVWGGTSNGHRLCWLTEAAPDGWPVVVWHPRDGDFDVYRMGAVEFVEGWLSGRVDCPMFPGEFTATARWFDPPRRLTHVYVRLTEGTLTFAERLRILRDALAPTVDRRSVDAGDGTRQEIFVATDAQWRVTYETAYGHQIRIAFPAGDGERARAAILRAVDRIGCAVVSMARPNGAPVWGG